MKATVVGFESGKTWSDGERRITIQFQTQASGLRQTATFLESELPPMLALDDVVDVKFTGEGQPNGKGQG